MEQNTTQPIVPPARPKNWLVESILVTIFCCLIFGIISIVYAAQVNSKYDAGDYEGALQSSKEAGKWTRIGFFCGIAFVILYFLAIFMFGLGLPALWMGASSYD